MATTRVRDLMTEDVYSVSADDDLATLCRLMARHGVRHMPVVDVRGNLSGLVSQRDLSRHQLVDRDGRPAFRPVAAFETLRVRHLMTRPVETAEPELEIRIAAQIMFKHKYGCLPVLDRGQLVGILTESDFVRYLA